ncbi:MAG: class I SAM-dependent methyltransferase [Pedosphaera sp.]|nr:class I SAM-dependent methyltransferase [Pedosphaera sp.]
MKVISRTHGRIRRVGLFIPQIFAGWLLLALSYATAADASPKSPQVVVAPPVPLYESRANHSSDGLGKFFLDREIAHFMTHHGASWLERPEREEEEQPTRLVEALALKVGEVAADIGAGSGYLSWRMAKKVGPTGRVYANDIQPEMLQILRTNMLARGLTNVIPVLGDITDPRLPTNAVDLAIMVDVYHEFDHPFEMIREIVRSLKPGGRLVFVEYRGEEKWIPIKALHKMTEAQVRKEMALHPLEWVETLRVLPRQHVIVFRRAPP